ncbi:MAG: decaprenyl-phosphate phosphoribosyltransferase [Firmicutes bacterium]|nr:decaprenyl-phosphate phosphoribosyltransferase [Bacillota bacterium]
MKDYLKLLRIKHYIKNFIVFMPVFFSGSLFNTNKLLSAFLGLISFCLISSAIYIFNDYRDIEKDKNHPTKKNRPLASGKIKPVKALIIMALCVVLSISISLYLNNMQGIFCLFLYLILNIFYSIGLKDRPIIDVIILASGFVIRLFFGGFITDVPISKWLYLVVVMGSLYMGLGKRRNELKKQTDSREVLKYYNYSFLDKNMYVCVALANVFYALWTIEIPDSKMIWTVPMFIIILMCYSLDIEGNSDGDPTEVILKDKTLILLVIIYVIIVFGMLYFI